jgi:hypothetical protein
MKGHTYLVIPQFVEQKSQENSNAKLSILIYVYKTSSISLRLTPDL